MRIASIHFDATNKLIEDSGLKAEKNPINKLEQLDVIALIGKNGSGKSRMLKLVEVAMRDFKFKDQFNNLSYIKIHANDSNPLYSLIYKINNVLKKINDNNFPDDLKKDMDDILSLLKSNVFFEERVSSEKLQVEMNLNSWNTSFNTYDTANKIRNKEGFRSILTGALNFIINNYSYAEIKYVTISGQFNNNLQPDSIEEVLKVFLSAEELNNHSIMNDNSFKVISRNISAIVDEIKYHHAVIISKGKTTKITDDERVLLDRFDLFLERIKDFVGIELQIKPEIKLLDQKESNRRDAIGFEATWFDLKSNRLIQIKDLSPGQRTLLVYVTFLYLNEIQTGIPLSEQIILIDEPENHLHPSVQIELIQKLRNLIKGKGQLWIATHSPVIMAHLTMEEIFYMEDSKITPPNRKVVPQTLLDLFGSIDYVNKFGALVTDLQEWQFENFAEQCFTDAEVIDQANKSDPQRKQIENIRLEDGDLILDFAAGKGRLGAVLLAKNPDIRYHAYEYNEELHKQIRNNTENNTTIFKDLEAITRPAGGYKYIILCNALHEIPVEYWVENINKIIDLGSSDGSFIFMEDLYLPKGESPNKVGYLCLNQEAFAELLGIAEEHITTIEPEKKDHKGRLLCAVVPFAQLKPISSDHVRKAIESLKDYTLNKINELKKGNENQPIDIGRKSSFLHHQYVNCELALKKTAT